MFAQTEFGLGAVISRAAICVPSHRSFLTLMYFIGLFEYHVAFPVKTRSSMATESTRLHSWMAIDKTRNMEHSGTSRNIE